MNTATEELQTMRDRPGPHIGETATVTGRVTRVAHHPCGVTRVTIETEPPPEAPGPRPIRANVPTHLLDAERHASITEAHDWTGDE